jgi:hypothetical protein
MQHMVLGKALVLKNIESLRTAVLTGLQDADRLSLDIAEDVPVDLCGVQLIEAARRFASGQGKTLVLKRPATAFLDVLEAAGFLTDASPEDVLFWLHQGAAQ